MNVYQRAEAITLVHSGADYFERLVALLDEAVETIHLQVYIFAEDETGRRIAAALQRAAARGVQVWVLADEFGSRRLLSAAFIDAFTAAGIRFRFFDHLVSFRKWHFGRTLHHKVAVADRRQALVGGINIADKYHGTPDAPPWLDFAVQIRGEVCEFLHQLCDSTFRHQYFRRREWRRKSQRPLGDNPRGLLRFRQNDWLRGKYEIHKGYRQAMNSATESIMLTATYFLPGRLFRRSLARAVKRGRTVKILMSDPSDVPLFRLVEQYLQNWLLTQGVRVYLWQKSVMHGKSAVTDERWASIGSYNINYLSRYRSMELNVDILDPAFVRRFRKYLENLLETECVEITTTAMPYSGRFNRIKAWLAYHFVFYVMRLFFARRLF